MLEASFKLSSRVFQNFGPADVNIEWVKIVLVNSLFTTFADLHVRKVATFANLHSYTHTYCSFVLLNEAIPLFLVRTVRMH